MAFQGSYRGVWIYAGHLITGDPVIKPSFLEGKRDEDYEKFLTSDTNSTAQIKIVNYFINPTN